MIVDNGATPRISERSVSEITKISFEIIKLNENQGSAAGFKKGIEKAVEQNIDLIWLLDDDNEAHPEALQSLLKARELRGGRNDDIFFSFRKNRNKYLDAAYLGKQFKFKTNAFDDFHLCSLPTKIINRWFTTHIYEKVISPISSLESAIYGGMLFDQCWVSKVGFPDENYFVYLDDTDYSTRLKKAGANLLLVASSLVEDQETSWFINSNPKIPPIIDLNSDEERIYYTVRNKVYFETKFHVDSRFVYRLNILIYLTVSYIRCLIKSRNLKATNKRLKLICEAISDGFSKQMGSRSGTRRKCE